MTFISIHSVIIYVVFFGACMRCTRLCPLKPGVTPASGVFAADEEEDDMATYHRRQRAVCLTRARSSTSRSKEGRRAGERFQKEARVLWRAEREPDPRHPTPFLYTGHDASGNPQSNSTASVIGHIKNPRGTTSSEGSVSTI
jgi:hypothetical protein